MCADPDDLTVQAGLNVVWCTVNYVVCVNVALNVAICLTVRGVALSLSNETCI